MNHSNIEKLYDSKIIVLGIISTAIVCSGISIITTHAVMTIKHDAEIDKIKKEHRYKDSLLLHCNGQILKIRNSFMYQSYVESHSEYK